MLIGTHNFEEIVSSRDMGRNVGANRVDHRKGRVRGGGGFGSYEP